MDGWIIIYWEVKLCICSAVNLVTGILNNKLAGQALYLSHFRQDKDHSAVLPC
jgi:hypothetical protein